MDYREVLRQKTIPVEEAVLKVQSGDYIQNYGIAEPYGILSNLPLLVGKRENIELVDFLNYYNFDYYKDPAFLRTFNCSTLFFARFCSELQRIRAMSYIPGQLEFCISHRMEHNRRRGPGRRRVVFFTTVSPMDEHGYFTTGMIGTATRYMVEHADLVIVEVSESFPRTFGNTRIHVSEADWVVKGEDKLPVMPASKDMTEEDRVIGQYVADLIEDGSTLQLGIGGIPNGVAAALYNKHDLGIHTEMLNDGLVDLYEAGVVTNRKKTLFKGQTAAVFSFGSKKVYDFLDNNPGVVHMDVQYGNNPAVIAQNNKMVSVNSTLQIDLMGQCASEAIGTVQISGIGGQTETAVGAQASNGGKSIIALHSTAMVKNETGERECRSAIVGVHPAGTAISLMRSDIDYVVTEYGVADLLGASLRERAEELIKIAHPDFRTQLREEARRYYLI